MISENRPTTQGGIPTRYSVVPSLPEGLSLDSGSGVVSGTPRVASSSRSYAVTASNDKGAASCTIEIEVQEAVPGAPVITISSQPQSQTVSIGQQAMFRVSAAVDPSSTELHYQWQQGGMDIPGACLNTYSTPSVTMLDNNARFRVVITAGSAILASDEAILTVSSGPTPIIRISGQPQNQVVTVGQRATFRVNASASTGAALMYQWRKNGVAIPSATATEYTTPVAGSINDGERYSVVVSCANATPVTSNEAVLFVNGPQGGSAWYVDNAIASGANNGKSWTDAWRSLGAISWGSVRPGDVIYLSGGQSSKVYREQFDIRGNGAAGKPLTIRVGQESNHSGKVIIECPSTTGDAGVTFSNSTYVTLDGEVSGDCHIQVRNTPTASGISLSGNLSHIILRYLEINNNGRGDNQHGIALNVDSYDYPMLEVEYCKIHDNYQDQLNLLGPYGAVSDYGAILVHDNEIYNLSDDGIESTAGGLDFYRNRMYGRSNQGTGHPDGLQLYQGYCQIYNNAFFNLMDTMNAYIFMEHRYWSNDGHVRIYNNLLYEDVIRPGALYTNGIVVIGRVANTSLTDYLIANNTIVNIASWPLSFYSEVSGAVVSDVHIENNIIHNGSYLEGQAIMIGTAANRLVLGSHGDSGKNVIFDYNTVSAGHDGKTTTSFNGSLMSYASFRTQSTCQAHGLTSDPGLNTPNIDPGLAMAPKSGSSPVVNAGTSLLNYFSNDTSGIARPQGSAWDMGAYEFQEN